MTEIDYLAAIRRNLLLLAVISVFVVTYFTRELLLPIILGLLIALTLSPLSRVMARLGVPHAVSAFLLVGLTGIAIGIAVYFSSATVASWLGDSKEIGRELQFKLSGVFRSLESVKQAAEDVTAIAAADPAVAQEVILQQPSLLASAMSVAATAGTTFIVALVLAIFLLASGDMFYVKLVQSFPTLTGKKRALTIVRDIERQVSRYLLSITVINAGLGVAVGVTLGALGMEYAYIWGIAAFLLNYLPYLGGVIGTALAGVVAIVTFDSLAYAMLVPLSYQVLTGVEGQFITPFLVGRRLAINPVAIFLTVVVWAWLWGLPGALLAVPFLVTFKVICDNIDSLAVVANFLSVADVAVEDPVEA